MNGRRVEYECGAGQKRPRNYVNFRTAHSEILLQTSRWRKNSSNENQCNFADDSIRAS